jgi:hypothetical protein
MIVRTSCFASRPYFNRIGTLGIIAALRGDVRCAARLRGYMMRSCRVEGYRLEPGWERADETLIAALDEHLTEAEIESLAAEGARVRCLTRTKPPTWPSPYRAIIAEYSLARGESVTHRRWRT